MKDSVTTGILLGNRRIGLKRIDAKMWRVHIGPHLCFDLLGVTKQQAKDAALDIQSVFASVQAREATQ